MVHRLYQQLKNAYHFLQAHGWRVYYGRPDRALTIYAVTGTNGKTTTAIIVGNILRAAYSPSKVGLLTTIVLWVGEKEVVNETKMTTTKSQETYRQLRAMRDQGIEHVVLEVTSHALDQHRIAGIKLSGAIITNIAREHLDYHHTMAAYATAKQQIINYLKPTAPLVGKDDTAWVSKILQAARNQGVRTIQFTSAAAMTIATKLPGDVNKENVLAARLLTEAIGLNHTAIDRGVAAVTHVPGRMEWVRLPGKPAVLIDYAVTPDALERLYAAVRTHTQGKVFGVLGAAGLRDRGKRPDMARVVAQYVDELIITREDPWTEPEAQIFTDLEAGLKESTVSWQRIVDRRAALQHCIERATPTDVIVTTGKGAETGMAIGNEIIPWSERSIVEELLTAKA